jgi:metal-responsive CopG/Arc/MetJ family transcriptional regulator
MANIKTAISIQEPLFREVDAVARKMNISRSRLFALAARDFIQREENLQLLEQINKAYSEGLNAEERRVLAGGRKRQRQMQEGEW